jgi:hypothetical protein
VPGAGARGTTSWFRGHGTKQYRKTEMGMEAADWKFGGG